MKTKKFLALVMSTLMVASIAPVSTFANGATKADAEVTGSIHDVVNSGEDGNYTTLYYGGIPWKVLD